MLKKLKWNVKNCFEGKHFGIASTLNSKHLYFVPFGLTPLHPKGNSLKTDSL